MYQTIKSAKLAVVTLALATLSFSSFSQTSKFGISLNSLTTNFNYGASNNMLQSYKQNYKGLQAGFSYQAGITPMFSLVPELYFAMKGGTLKENNPLTGGKSTLRMGSLELPVLARVHFSNFYINAGPYVGYILSGRLKTEASQNVAETKTKVTFGSDMGSLKRWDAGLQAGAGYTFNMKKTSLTLDARYGYGLVNISNNVERYNRMLNISLVLSRISVKKHAEKKG